MKTFNYRDFFYTIVTGLETVNVQAFHYDDAASYRNRFSGYSIREIKLIVKDWIDEFYLREVKQ